MNRMKVATSRIFGSIPKPNHTMKSGASVSRGNEFNIAMNGSSTAANLGMKAKAKPMAVPAVAPSTKPMEASVSVTARLPNTRPARSQPAITPPISLGELKKNAEIRPSRAAASHRARSDTIERNLFQAVP